MAKGDAAMQGLGWNPGGPKINGQASFGSPGMGMMSGMAGMGGMMPGGSTPGHWNVGGMQKPDMGPNGQMSSTTLPSMGPSNQATDQGWKANQEYWKTHPPQSYDNGLPPSMMPQMPPQGGGYRGFPVSQQQQQPGSIAMNPSFDIQGMIGKMGGMAQPLGNNVPQMSTPTQQPIPQDSYARNPSASLGNMNRMF